MEWNDCVKSMIDHIIVKYVITVMLYYYKNIRWKNWLYVGSCSEIKNKYIYKKNQDYTADTARSGVYKHVLSHPSPTPPIYPAHDFPWAGDRPLTFRSHGLRSLTTPAGREPVTEHLWAGRICSGPSWELLLTTGSISGVAGRGGGEGWGVRGGGLRGGGH